MNHRPAKRPPISRLTALLFSACLAGHAAQIKSPDGRIAVSFGLQANGEATGCPVYAIHYQGRQILADSRLGLELADGALNGGFTITGQTTNAADSVWQPVCGERATIRDHYNG